MRYRIKKWFLQTAKQEQIQRCMRYPLYLCSIVYGGVIQGRIFLYRTGVLKVKTLPCTVISIGNLTVGGSGKTPMTIFIARRLASMGKKCAVVSRGYGGTWKGPPSVVSNGVDVLMTAEEAGDEPVLIAIKSKGVPVIICHDRYLAGLLAIKRFDINYIILDDGFQHLRLNRDINILLMTPARRDTDNYLLPRGILREPTSEKKRADILMIKGEPVSAEVSSYNTPLFRFDYRPTRLISVYGHSEMEVSVLKGKRVALLSGIADPESFTTSIGETGAKVVEHMSYPDHHRFSESDMESINRRLHLPGKNVDMVITTEKDMVRLRYVKRIDCDTYAMAIEVDIEGAEVFERLIFQ